MKVYILFAYDRYYPDGGLADIQGVYATPEDAQVAKRENRRRYDHLDIVVIDTDSLSAMEVAA